MTLEGDVSNHREKSFLFQLNIIDIDLDNYSALLLIMSFVFRHVNRVFERRPMITNAVTGFASFALGDLLCQSVERKIKQRKAEGHPNTIASTLDYLRALQIGVLGIWMNGIVMITWFKYLDRAFGTSMTSPRILIAKTIADQVIYAPCGIATFFAYTTFLDTLQERAAILAAPPTIQQVHLTTCESSQIILPITQSAPSTFESKMNSSFMSTFLADCSVWPMVNMIQFRYVPLHWRPTTNGVVALVWQAYMSSVAYRDVTVSSDEEGEEK